MGSALLFLASPNRAWYCIHVMQVVFKYSKFQLSLTGTICLKVQPHQFIGNQVIKIFAAKDDEVRMGRACTLLAIPCWRWPVAAAAVSSEQHAGVALSALVRALHELQMLAIVRYAYDRRSNPQIGAALPCVKQHYEVWSCSSAQTAGFSKTEQRKYVSPVQ